MTVILIIISFILGLNTALLIAIYFKKESPAKVEVKEVSKYKKPMLAETHY